MSPSLPQEEALEPRPTANDKDEQHENRARVERLVREHTAFIWRTLRRQGLPPAAADDAAQQVFMVAYTRIADIKAGAEKAFLYGTALRVAADARQAFARMRSRTDESADATEVAGTAPDPEAQLQTSRARALLDEVLAALSDDHRAVLVLYELEGMTVPEIAALLGVPTGTAASRLGRAREEFTRQVERRTGKGKRDE